MPIDYRPTSADLSQREAFARSRLARAYRAMVDRTLLGNLRGCPAWVDIGAGEAILLEKFRALGEPGLALALDRHPENARIARGFGFPAVLGDAAELPLASGSVAVAVLANMLEHVDDPAAVLSEACRVLRPGGVALVLVPHEKNFHRARRLLGRREEADLDYGHVQEWTPASLSEALRRAGLRPVGRRNLPLPFWRLALHHLVIAERPR